ncbi:MAG: peroxidase-related enzyme [Gammaproteobacteria bacterium]|nr:peroxidase-related enzyme [Gammaproteobacteria bacterium]
MAWIRTVDYEDAEGALKTLYDRIKGPGNNVDNIMMAHSLRPHTMEGHMTLYKYVLHHPRNVLPKSYLETIGVYVSILNHCRYCVDHHYTGLKRLLKDAERSTAIRSALDAGVPGAAFEGRDLAGLHYVHKLTVTPADLRREDVDALRAAGFDDGEILEINQVTAYFAYANRMVLGLGIDTEGDIIGLSPGASDDPDDWNHG